MEETWRWFGPEDTVSLEQIQQELDIGVDMARERADYPRDDQSATGAADQGGDRNL